MNFPIAFESHLGSRRNYVPSHSEMRTIVPSQPGRPALFPDNKGKVVRRSGLAPWQRKKVIMYIDENLSTSIRVEQLAEMAKLSLSHFSRAFNTVIGVPPYMYILQRRIEHAKSLMLLTNSPLSQIALDCGMTDQAHLCKVFRKVVGTSPNRWRRPRKLVGDGKALSVH